MVLALTAASAHAQAFSITALPTAPTTGAATYPTMVTDAKGNVNLAWIDSAKGIMFARSADGKTFPTQVTVQVQPATGAPVLPAFPPQMAIYATQTNVVVIVWASLNPTPATPPNYDVFAARSDDSGAHFATTQAAISTAPLTPAGVPLAGSPRVAFDFSGGVNVVWGTSNVWISRAQSSLNFIAPVSLVPVVTPPTPQPVLHTGGPRVIASADNHLFVAWTDEEAEIEKKPGNFCTNSTKDATGKISTNTFGGNFYMNETFPDVNGSPTGLSANNTRNLSTTDWNAAAAPGVPPANPEFPIGFFGCSFNNLTLFTGKAGLVHLLWSDDQPGEDILTSVHHGTYPAGSPFAGDTEFSFPSNLADLSASSPSVATDQNNIMYVVWSGGPTGGGFETGATNSQGIFFIRSDDDGSTFTSCAPGAAICPAKNIAPATAFAPAYPQVAVDSKNNVSVAWEQPHKKIAADGSDTFDVFLAGSPDKGATFSTLSQVSTNSSLLCIPGPTGTPPAAPTTPDATTCGTIQLGLDVNSSPVIAWVNKASSGTAAANIDFAAKSGNDFTVTLPAPSKDALAGQTATFTVNTAAVGTFAGSITLSCSNFSAPAANLTCSVAGGAINAGQSTTVSVALPATLPAGAVTFTINGTSGGTTHSVKATINVGTPPTPGFSVGVTASSPGALAGGAATFTYSVQITPTNGFSGPVTLSCGADVPAGATCSFNPQPATSTSTLTVSTPSSVAKGRYSFTVTGKSGSITSSQPATLTLGTITASASASSATIAVGSSANFTFNLSSSDGFNGNVTLGCVGLPTGITCTTPSTAVPGSATLTVSVGSKPTGSLIQNGPRGLDGLLGLQRNTVFSMAFVALALILCGMIAASRRQKPLPLARGLAVMALVMVLAVGLISCGGSTSTTSTGGGGGGTGGTGGQATPFNGQVVVQAQSNGATTNLSTLSITVP